MTKKFPLLPLRDIVVFPDMVIPLFVGRDKSVAALEHASKTDKKIVLSAQKNSNQNDPKIKDIHSYGTIANILQLLKLPDGTVKVLVEGMERVEITSFLNSQLFYEAKIEIIESNVKNTEEAEILARTVSESFSTYVKLNKKIPVEALNNIAHIDEPSKLADIITSNLIIKLKDKQEILECVEVVKRLEILYRILETEIGLLNTEKQIRRRVETKMKKTQKDYYLNEQLKAIQAELGEEDDQKNELDELEKDLKKKKLSKETKEKVAQEMKKLRRMSSMSAEASVIRNYLEWIISLPWKEPLKIKHDLKKAEQILNEDHYGLEKVKERVLEYLAVQERVTQMKGPILCLVGPPGVGKTSLARSVARATGREYVRVSLGGVRDEAEIRGHRRTYIGAMPGKVIQSMKKAKKSNPLMLFDEVDKMSNDSRGDPASAMLEVLDPEQNSSFNDHYLEVDYDLSEVLFIATANSFNMPRPLMDRMEIIRLSGYTEDEKIEIAKRHLITKQKKAHGLKESEWSISEGALKNLIRYYTREAGLRNLEREIATLARKAVKEIITTKKKKISVTIKNLEKYAGVQKYSFGVMEKDDQVGIVTGLAYTEVGGELLLIEALTIPGKGKMTITGKLGDVMQESIQAAASYVRSHCLEYGIIPPEYRNKDIHVHVPEGATPKDGPSAGVAMFIAIVSVLTNIPIKRSIAMTGEITLRGRVLPIGGLKEKLLAALRGGIKTVLIPKDNAKDLAEIPDNVKAGLEIIPIENAYEALKLALVKIPEATTWEEKAIPLEKKGSEEGAALRH